MDSGNSASLQSSSGGGGDELDSRYSADSSPLSALLRPPSPSSMPGFGGGGGSLVYGLHQEHRTPPVSHWHSTAPLPAAADASPPPPSSLPSHGAKASSAAADQAQADAAPAQATAAAPQPRGSRKRARASRRAPTTVLTTDTSNFRAMVQEFTGIPAPPFAAAAAARSPRFDHHLFPLRTATATAAAGTALPQYLLRPFVAHKLHASSTPYMSSPAASNISIAPAASTTTPGTTASPLLGMQMQQQDHQSSSSNYHSFHHQSSTLGDGKYTAHPAFYRGLAPPPPSSATRLQDPAGFLGPTQQHGMLGSQGPHAHLNPRNGDELSGVVGGAAVAAAGGACKATTYSSTRTSRERNRRNASADVSTATTTADPVPATAGMRTQAGVVDSWVCTSD